VSGLETPHELPGGGRVVFTERLHGNMSSVGGASSEHGAQARDRIRESLGLDRLIRGYQVHGAAVTLVHKRPDAALPATKPAPADGQATTLIGVGAMVLAADCLPVALGCTGAVAMVHAGWRGLAGGVLEQGVLALRELAGEQPVVAVVGPCAGACCYEVGSEVHDAFDGAHRRGRLIDLRAIAHDRLLAAGAAEVRDVQACTICQPRYFSHRREGSRAGRQAGIAWLS
jgi:polyphenol oxidase